MNACLLFKCILLPLPINTNHTLLQTQQDKTSRHYYLNNYSNNKMCIRDSSQSWLLGKIPHATTQVANVNACSGNPVLTISHPVALPWVFPKRHRTELFLKVYCFCSRFQGNPLIRALGQQQSAPGDS